MTSPDREKRSGLKDEVLAGQYVLGALSADANAELAQRIQTDPQFASMVRRWHENLAVSQKPYRKRPPPHIDASMQLGLRRADDGLHRSIYGRFAIISSLWNSVRFWRLTALAALLWAAALVWSGV